MITLTTTIWRTINQVNLDANRRIGYLSDQEHYGTSEFWEAAPDGLGDCEDYALVKQMALAERGVKSYLATCWVGPDKTGYHAVLLIDTDRGTYVMDNRDDAIWAHGQLDYTWDKRQMEDGTWHAIVS